MFGILWGCREQSVSISRRGVNLQDCAALCMHHLSLMIVRFPGRQYVDNVFELAVVSHEIRRLPDMYEVSAGEDCPAHKLIERGVRRSATRSAC